MPDPKDPSPVSVVERDGKFVIVTADGKPLADGDEYVDYAKAETDAATINSSWKNAAAERKAKGMTEARIAETLGLTEWRPLEGGAQLASRSFRAPSPTKFNPALHPHGTHGHFAQHLGAMKVGGKTDLPSGVHVRRGHNGWTVHEPYTGDAAGPTHKTPEDAARQAMLVHADVAAHAHKVVANGATVSVHPSRAEAMRHKQPGQQVKRVVEAEPATGPSRRELERRVEADAVHHARPGTVDRVRKSNRDDDARRARSASDRAWRMEESAVASVLHGGPQIHLHFDPRLHRRDRAGKFAETLGKLTSHGSTVELPHGVKVENHLGKLRVHSPYGDRRFSTPEAAAAVAIAGVDHGEAQRGGIIPHAHQMSELEGARRAAMGKSAIGDLHHIEAVQAELRKSRPVSPSVPSHRGRTAATRAAYAEQHHGGTVHDVIDRARVEATTLPPASEEADAIRPALDAAKLKLVTGYGEYAAHPNPGAPNIYDLHRNGTRLAVLGTHSAAHGALAAIHDEAMQRHLSAKADARTQAVRDILKA